jgi:hypothetical protein
MPGAALIHETGKLCKTSRPRRGRRDFNRNEDRGHHFLLKSTDRKTLSRFAFDWREGVTHRGHNFLLKSTDRKTLSRFAFDWREGVTHRGHIFLLMSTDRKTLSRFAFD